MFQSIIFVGFAALFLFLFSLENDHIDSRRKSEIVTRSPTVYANDVAQKNVGFEKQRNETHVNEFEMQIVFNMDDNGEGSG